MLVHRLEQGSELETMHLVEVLRSVADSEAAHQVGPLDLEISLRLRRTRSGQGQQQRASGGAARTRTLPGKSKHFEQETSNNLFLK